MSSTDEYVPPASPPPSRAVVMPMLTKHKPEVSIEELSESRGEVPESRVDVESGVESDYDEETHRMSMELYRESSQRHLASTVPTFGRLRYAQQMEAIDEVDRALELDELRNEVQGKPHSRALSIHRVHFTRTLTKDHSSRESEPKEDVVELDTEIGPEPEAKPDISGAIFNLMNYAVGAGILALPYAFRQAGLILGFGLVTIVGLSTLFSMFLLLAASRASHAFGYEQLARISYGDRFAQFVKVIIIVDSFGALSAYMILIADTTHAMAKTYLGTDSIWTNKLLVLTLVTVFIMLPLCSLKNINYLGFTSALSLAPLVYFIILQIVYFIKGGGIQPGLRMFNSQILYALPIIIFSFSSQQALFPLYTELKERNGTERHIKMVATWSVALTALCYLFSGTIGVFTYPTTAYGNVLHNLPAGIAVDILLFTTAVSIIFSFPVILWPARVSVDRLFFLDRPYSYLRFVLEAAGILLISFLIAVAVPSFSTVLGLFGSLTNTCIGYVLPPLFYVKLAPSSWKTSRFKQLALVLLILGTILGLIAAGVITYDYIDSRIKGEKPEGDT